ncbi:MAG: hypothetical protein AAF085_14365 [Planctomycetota bacterium]
MNLVPYGAALTIYRPMMLAGTYLTSAPTIAAGDVQISKDGGVFANVATLPTFTNGQLAIALSATELQAEQVTIRWVDQTADKEWDDDASVLTTAGNGSALLSDVNVAMRGTDGANTTTPPTVAEIEAALINEGDSTALLQAIADKLAADFTTADVSVQAIASATRDAILAHTLDGVPIDDLLLLIGCVLLSKSSNGGNTFRDLQDTKDRVVSTVDASNNRTTVTRDAS